MHRMLPNVARLRRPSGDRLGAIERVVVSAASSACVLQIALRQITFQAPSARERLAHSCRSGIELEGILARPWHDTSRRRRRFFTAN